MSTDTREALAALMVIAAECAQRKPLRGFEELTEAIHIGHRQFGRAHEKADEDVRMLAVRLRAVFDTLAAALATQPAQPVRFFGQDLELLPEDRSALEAMVEAAYKKAPELRAKKAAAQPSAPPAAYTVSGKPLVWSHTYDDQWLDEDYGFSIMLERDSETPYNAAWGEGDSEDFATLEEAKAWCQAEIDAWVRRSVVVTPAQPSAQGEAVALSDEDWQAIADEADAVIWSRLKQAVNRRLAMLASAPAQATQEIPR